jgi:hypothetical protein
MAVKVMDRVELSQNMEQCQVLANNVKILLST